MVKITKSEVIEISRKIPLSEITENISILQSFLDGNSIVGLASKYEKSNYEIETILRKCFAVFASCTLD